MKPFISLFAISLFLFLIPAQPLAQDNTVEGDRQRIEEQLKELGEELHRKLMDSIRQLLERETTRLKTGRQSVDTATRKQIENLEEILKKDPGNAHAHFEAGELHDQLGDGASAIIHMHRAEQLFAAARDRKGVAEARRELRHYYSKYDFRTEDFDLPK